MRVHSPVLKLGTASKNRDRKFNKSFCEFVGTTLATIRVGLIIEGCNCMGRFARSNGRSKAQANLEATRGAFRSWKLNRQHRDAQPQKQNKTDRKIFKLVLLVLLLVIGVSSGWMTGRIFIGSSQSNLIQPAAMVESAQGGEVEADKNNLDADKSAAPVGETGEKSETARARHAPNADDNDKTRSDRGAPVREQSSIHSAPQPPETGARTGRRYARGRNFQPTTIVTKPAKVLSKPFKKLNPFKIF
jgi:hypothetical protein